VLAAVRIIRACPPSMISADASSTSAARVGTRPSRVRSKRRRPSASSKAAMRRLTVEVSTPSRPAAPPRLRAR
jgi:hypothetical protein